MLTLLARNWWMVALRGLIAVLFGVAALIWPQITLVALVLLFGAYALIDGTFAAVVAVVGRREHRQWWLVLVEGLLGIVLGVLVFLWPDTAALAFLYLIAGWAVVTGLLEIVVAIILRKELRGEWLLVLGGLVSMAFGLIVAFRPDAGALAIVWLIGAYAILSGLLLIVFGFRLRGWRKRLQEAWGGTA